MVGFGYLVGTNTTYYAIDWSGNKIIIFDENWRYLTYKIFSGSVYMITVNNNLYISGDNNVYKTDKYLNIITRYNYIAYFRGLYYNSSSNIIYVAGYTKCKIYVFDLNLSLVDTIATSTHQPYSLEGYRKYIFAGTMSGQLLVIENKVIVKMYPVCSGTQPTAIIVDQYGYMAFCCYHTSATYLYYTANVSYTNMSLTYSVNPYFINFDSNGRFVVISPKQIDIYY